MVLGSDSGWHFVLLILDFVKERGQRSNQPNRFILPRIEIMLPYLSLFLRVIFFSNSKTSSGQAERENMAALDSVAG